MEGFAGAGGLVAWRNELRRAADRLDRLGPATRACCAAAAPMPTVVGAELFSWGARSLAEAPPADGHAMADPGSATACAPAKPAPARAVPKQRESKQPEPEQPVPGQRGPERPVGRRRRAESRLEPPCGVDESHLRALVEPPPRPASEPRPDPWPVRRPRVKLRAVDSADCSAVEPTKEPQVVEAAEVPTMLAGAAGRRITAEPDCLVDTLRRSPRVGQAAAAELLDRLRGGGAQNKTAPEQQVEPRQPVEWPGGQAVQPMQEWTRQAQESAQRLPGAAPQWQEPWQGRAPARRGTAPAEQGEARAMHGRAAAGQEGVEAWPEQPPAGRESGRARQESGPAARESGPAGQESGQADRESGQAGRAGQESGQLWGLARQEPGEVWPGDNQRESAAVGARSGAAEASTRGWADESPSEQPGSSGWDDADVERVLERVLGDAARRHGIEV